MRKKSLLDTSWTYIYDREWTADAWNGQPEHKLELGDQDVYGSCCGEAGHQSVGQVHDNKSHLKNPHRQLHRMERNEKA